VFPGKNLKKLRLRSSYGQIFSHSFYLNIIEPERRAMRDRMRIMRVAQVSSPFIHTAVIVTPQRRGYSGDTMPVNTVTRFATPLKNEPHALRHKRFETCYLQTKPFPIGCRRVVHTSAHQTE
jgi:hypothetical protein